jgi:hypothetical protein
MDKFIIFNYLHSKFQVNTIINFIFNIFNMWMQLGI